MLQLFVGRAMGHLKLGKKEREHLEEIVSSAQVSSRKYRRARGLLGLDAGETLEAIAKDLRVHRVTVAAWRDTYNKSKLALLEDKPRKGRPNMLDGMQRAKITALACSEAPDGHSQWSLRLLADKVVELGYCEEISHKQVGRVLKKTNLSRTSKKRGASGR